MPARGYRIKGTRPPVLATDSRRPSPDRPSWVRLRDSGPADRAQLKRFILIGLYTGARPGVTPQLLWAESPSQAWMDLDKAMIWRRGRREREHATKRRPVVKIPARLLQHMRRCHIADSKLMERRKKAELPMTNSVIHHRGHGRLTHPRSADLVRLALMPGAKRPG